jgi:hypothetical protein
MSRTPVLVFAAMCAFATAASPGPCELTIARFKYGGGGDWYANPSSLPNLVAAVKQRTAVPLCDTVATVELLDERLLRFPFIYMTGHGNVHFSPDEQVRLRAYLEAGGFLWADDCYGMDQSLRRELKALFPTNPLQVVPRDHAIYSSVYRMPGLPKIHEHDGSPAQGLGIFVKNRLVVFYTFSSDIGDGMEDLDVHNDGPELHEQALRMGVNIVAWFLSP